MMIWIKAYVASLVAFLVLDGLWLGVVTRSWYPKQIGHLMAENVNAVAAAAFYAVYLVGVVVLAVRPALESGGLVAAAVAGAVLGIVAYGTYGFTNLAVMRDWPLAMTLVDTAWGGFLTALAAVAGTWAARL